MPTRLTLQRVEKWNQNPLEMRDGIFRMLNAAWESGLLYPRPLWKGGKIVLSRQMSEYKPTPFELAALAAILALQDSPSNRKSIEGYLDTAHGLLKSAAAHSATGATHSPKS